MIFDGTGHRTGDLRIKARKTATVELPPGRYRLGYGHGRPTVKQLEGCKPKTATVTAGRTTNYTLRLGCWPSTPRGVLASVVAAARAQKSVRLTVTHGEDLMGTTTQTIDSDGNSAEARETLFGTGAKLESRLVNGTVYVRGNENALLFLVSLASTQASRYAGQWISITPKDKLMYDRLAYGLTPASYLPSGSREEGAIAVDPRVAFVLAGSPLTLSRRTSHGRRLLDLETTGPYGVSDWDLTAHASGDPLPVTFDYGCGQVCDYHGTFSNWNKPVHVEAPASPTPIATVRG